MRIRIIGIAALPAVMLAGGISVSAKTLGYQCNIVNNGALRGVFGPVNFHFNDGYLELRTPGGQAVCGEVAHYMPLSGENFLFNYSVDNATGRTTAAINGEVVASAVFHANIDKTSLNEHWSWAGTGAEVKNEVRSEDPVNSIKQNTVSGNTAKVTFETAVPLQYSSLKNLAIMAANGDAFPIIDYTKDKCTVTLYTQKAMISGQSYTISGSVTDVYGITTTVSAAYTPQEDGTLTVGKDLVLNNEQRNTFGFEFRSKWYTEPRFVFDYQLPISSFTIGKNNGANPYDDKTYDYYSKLNAMQISEQNVQEGRYSLKWDKHNEFATLAAFDIPSDWTGANELSLSIYSEKETNETVTIVIYSDALASKWRDGYTYSFVIDWEGWRELAIPLQDFNIFNNPAGFKNVSSINFTTKTFDHDASPSTVLYLDNMKVIYNSSYPVTPAPMVRRTPEYAHRGALFNAEYLNHDEPEVASSFDKSAPFDYTAYYRKERETKGYFPKYVPGVVSFDEDGKAYIRADSTHIQCKDETGKWQMIDIDEEVHKYVSSLSDTRVWDSGAPENVIRFDSDGWAYLLITAGGEVFLMYSKDGMNTWQGVKTYATVKRLIGSECTASLFTTGKFEHIDGGNMTAAAKPPVILLNQAEGAEHTGGYMLIPEKTEDGSGLEFTAFKYADSCIIASNHTGDGNSVVTRGDYAYIVYGDPNDNTTATGLNGDLSYEFNGYTYEYKYGVPTYIVKYDMVNKTSEKQFLGYGGAKSEAADSDYATHDVHNWPGIAIDSLGYIHVIMNGHHHPICYTKSKIANNITSWETVQQIGNENIVLNSSTKNASRIQQTYGAMILDKNDNVYVMTRDASRGYRFDTSVYVKTSWTEGLLWDQTTKYGWVYTPVVKRLTPYYEIARQKLTYNPYDDSLYMFYYAQSNYGQFFRDEIDAQMFERPDIERTVFINSPSGELPYGVSEGIVVDGKRSEYISTFIANNVPGYDGVLVKASGVGSGFTGVVGPAFRLLESSELN